MNNYEVLGVRKDASEEDIRLAYKKRISIIDREIHNREKADLYKSVLKNAYNELMAIQATSNNIGQVPEETIVMSVDEINNLLNKTNDNDELYDYDDDELYDDYDDEYYYDDYEYDDYDDNDYYQDERKKQNNKKKSKSKKKKSSSNKKNKTKKKDAEKNYGKEEKRKHNNKEYEEESSSLWLLPLKILVFPFFIILSIIIFILDIVSAVIWIVTKLLIILSIAVAAVHGYQIYSGSDMLRYDILAACGAAFVVGICLPLATKIIVDPLKSLNTSLKDFIF